MVCIAHTGIHSHLHSVPGCANIGAPAQEQLQPGMHCATLLGRPHLLCDRRLHHPDRYAQWDYSTLQYVPFRAMPKDCGACCSCKIMHSCICGCSHMFIFCAGANNKQWKAMKDAKTIWIGIVAGVGAGLLCLCTVIPYLRWKIPKEMEMQRRYTYTYTGLVCSPYISLCPLLLPL